ncbi:MAG: NAD(P)H-binding protein [Myxococcales bacterium]|nr:NAD(P)H-binding protein [Myxococcales bacterium]
MPSSSTETAFIAGATGYTGREVVRRLAARGISAIAHVRPDSDRLTEWRERFAALGATVDETPWNETAMTATLARRRPTVIFALLGTTRARMKNLKSRGVDPQTGSYDAVDYGLTALLLRAAKTAGITPRFVYLSAIGVGPKARGGYYQARWRLETELQASGLPFVIARPAFISGPDREESRPSERAGATIFDGLLTAAGAVGLKKLQNKFSSLSGSELAAALVNLALAPDAANRVFEADALRQASADK